LHPQCGAARNRRLPPELESLTARAVALAERLFGNILFVPRQHRVKRDSVEFRRTFIMPADQ
jgi:hypothetical protein